MSFRHITRQSKTFLKSQAAHDRLYRKNQRALKRSPVLSPKWVKKQRLSDYHEEVFNRQLVRGKVLSSQERKDIYDKMQKRIYTFDI